jgi:F-type H+-transporting ATPase subunit gamma
MLIGGLRRTVDGLMGRRLAKGFAESEKDIKLRLKSIQSTRKITKAMKMVATAKMKHEVDRLEAGKNFGVNVVPTMFQNDEYMMKKVGDIPVNKTLLIPVTTDK